MKQVKSFVQHSRCGIFLLSLFPLMSYGVETIFDASAGILSESNQVLEDTDTISQIADEALSGEITAGVSTEFKHEGYAEGSYTWSSVNFQNSDDFDLDMHLVSLSSGFKIADVGLAIDGFSAEASVNKQAYLQLWQVTPTINLMLNKSWMVYGKLGVAERKFLQDLNRDDDEVSVSLRFYHIINSTNHYLMVGLEKSERSANSTEFDAQAHQVVVDWIKKMQWNNRELHFSLRCLYEGRLYSSTTPRRKDNVMEIIADAKWHLSEHLYLASRWGYADNASSVEQYSYQQSRFELRFGVQF